MFKFLKEKIKNWTKEVAKNEEEKVPEEEVKEIKIEEEFNPGTQKYEPNLEKIKEESEKVQKQEEKKSVFQSIKSKITKTIISEQDFDVYSEELEFLLLENNVALEVAEKIVSELRQKIVGKEIAKKELENQINNLLKETIKEILIDPFEIEKKVIEKKEKSSEPYTIVFCGINGTGKTTSVAKVAELLQNKKLSVVLAAADTFRAASIEQIKKHSENLNLKLISHDYGSDPASVGFDAIKYAKKNKIDVVLIDTAGRMHTDKNLLKEIEKIVKVTNPDLKIFVGESITGNDAVEQAKSFNESVKIDGIILTKADIDEKGGTALSVGYSIRKPILYLGTGQEYSSFEIFNKDKFLEKLGL